MGFDRKYYARTTQFKEINRFCNHLVHPPLWKKQYGETMTSWILLSPAVSRQKCGRARLRALEAFGFLMLKYAFSHILETLFLLFLTSILTPKVDKNRALDFTSINLRHSDMLHLFFNLHEKVML